MGGLLATRDTGGTLLCVEEQLSQSRRQLFGSHEKPEQVNFFTLMSVWQSVKMLDGRRERQHWMPSLERDTNNTLCCSRLVSSVCVSVKTLMSLYSQAAG